MPQVTETELKKQLDAESFAPVYFFYGPETYIVSSFVKRFLKKAGAVPFRISMCSGLMGEKPQWMP